MPTPTHHRSIGQIILSDFMKRDHFHYLVVAFCFLVHALPGMTNEGPVVIYSDDFERCRIDVEWIKEKLPALPANELSPKPSWTNAEPRFPIKVSEPTAIESPERLDIFRVVKKDTNGSPVALLGEISKKHYKSRPLIQIRGVLCESNSVIVLYEEQRSQFDAKPSLVVTILERASLSKSPERTMEHVVWSGSNGSPESIMEAKLLGSLESETLKISYRLGYSNSNAVEKVVSFTQGRWVESPSKP